MHWTSKYVGLKYQPGVFDCASLAKLVQKERFGRDIQLPMDRPYVEVYGQRHRFQEMAKQIEENRHLVERVITPQEGDIALLEVRGYVQHIGVYCLVNGEPFVLHAASQAKQVVLQRVREMAIRGLKIEGYYRWK